jgi:hypothetical protein
LYSGCKTWLIGGAFILPYLYKGDRGVTPPPLPGAIYTGLLPLQIKTELLLDNLTDVIHILDIRAV